MIVSSIIAWSNIQVDGRSSVREIHTDDENNEIIIDYMADADVDQNAHLAMDATNLSEQQAATRLENEVGTNVQLVLALGSTATITLQYSTLQENAAQLMVVYPTVSGVQAINIGDYLNSQTDDTLMSGSGLAQADIDSYRPLWSSNAVTAAAIRSAVGV